MKKVLWLTGIVIPQASSIIDQSKVPFGGWVSQMIDQLSNNSDYIIGVAMKSTVNELIVKNKDNVTYYFLPQKKANKFDIHSTDVKQVLADFNPDLVHAEGTELKYTNTFLKEWKGSNVVSLQGVINGYEPYEYGQIDFNKIIRIDQPLNTVFALLSIINKKFIFNKRLSIEIDTIKRAHNILGRTNWDRAHSYFYNPSAPYYHCARILRPSFYKSYSENKIPFSVFIGNSAQSRKGAHFVLEAIKLLKPFYSQIKLYVTGQSFYSDNSLSTKFGYRGYLKRLVEQFKLSDHIEFLGVLNEEEMARTISKMHIYVMSSVIENSPNTLGEAMMLGIPVVTSFNGGVNDMCTDGIEAIHYRANDPKALAYSIKRLFDDPELADRLANNAKIKAKQTHNPKKNYQDLINCYKAILND